MLDLLLIPLLALGSVQDVKESKPEDARTVKELRKDLKKEEEVKQRSAILKLLASRAAIEPEEAKSAWDEIADGLQDKSFEVRREAVRLLMTAPDREVAVKSLTAALDKSMIEAGAAAGERGGRGGGGGRSPLAGAFGSKPRDPDEIARSKKAHEATAGREFYFAEIINAVADLPDDRSVKAMSRYFELAPGRALEKMQVPTAKALAQLGTRGALETIRKTLEKTAEMAAKEKEMAARGVQPGSSDGPSAQMIATGLHEALLEAVKKAGLADPPAYDDQVARNWKRFLSKSGKVFPTKLGKIKPFEEKG